MKAFIINRNFSLMFLFAIFVTFLMIGSPARAEIEHPCKKVAKACENAGFYAGGAHTGHGLHVNCMLQLIGEGKKIEGVEVGAGVLKACKAKPHPCMKLEAACETAGYHFGGYKEDKGFHFNCMLPLIEGKTVPGLDVKPGTLKACQKLPHPCMKLESACEAGGYEPEAAATGKGIIKDCVTPLLAGDAVPGVTADASAVKDCQKLRGEPKKGKGKGAPGNASHE